MKGKLTTVTLKPTDKPRLGPQKPFPISDHCDGKRFFNVDPSLELKNHLLNFLKWKMKDKKTPWPKFIENHVKPHLPEQIEKGKAAITFINHATLLIQFSDLNILTDPVFSKRVSPLNWLGPKRIRPPGVALKDLPKIDVISISHNHYDHLDLPSLKKLNHLFKPLFIVPLGNAKLLNSVGIKNVRELDWWESIHINHCAITLTPAQHWSARGLRDRNKTLWGGFIYHHYKQQIFFAGDTGYSQHFKEIFKKFGAMSISLLPIGAYEPRWFMKNHHMNPEESVLAHIDLHSQLSIGMHFGTFCLTNEGYENPVRELKNSLNLYHVPEEEFFTLQQGETKII